MKDDSFLILGIPAGDGNTLKYFGEKSISCWIPEHKILYSEKGLKIILSKNALSMISCIRGNPFSLFLLSELQSRGETQVVYWRHPAIKSKKISFLLFVSLCMKSFFASMFAPKQKGDSMIAIIQKKKIVKI